MREVKAGVNIGKSEFGQWGILIKWRQSFNTALSKEKMYDQGGEMKRMFFKKGTGD